MNGGLNCTMKRGRAVREREGGGGAGKNGWIIQELGWGKGSGSLGGPARCRVRKDRIRSPGKSGQHPFKC